MKVYDDGSFFTVRYTADDTEFFSEHWPGSTVAGSGSFEFDKKTGDLVDASGTAAEGDGDDWLAFSEHCQEFGARLVGAGR